MTLARVLDIATTRRAIASALRVSLVVGTALNLINQWDVLFAAGDFSLSHCILNYLVPFFVSGYSAARNEAGREDSGWRKRMEP